MTTGNTRIFCFGIGTDVNTHLLDRLTEQSARLQRLRAARGGPRSEGVELLRQDQGPGAGQSHLSFTGDLRATKLYPSPLPDLFKGEQLVLAGRYAGHGNGTIVIEGTVNGARAPFTSKSSSRRNPPSTISFPRLWATRRVGYLLDEIRLHGESAELRDEVTELARQYGIVTPYTAYLIVEDEARRGVAVNMRSLQDMDKIRTPVTRRRRAWTSVNGQVSGEMAIAGAELNKALRDAPGRLPHCPAVSPWAPDAEAVEQAEAEPEAVDSMPRISPSSRLDPGPSPGACRTQPVPQQPAPLQAFRAG